MRRKPTAGPVVFGRWSRPAALVNAGLVQPDLFPLEKLLFCARCGQQFIGAHRTGTPTEDTTDAAGSANRPGGVRQPGCACSPGGGHAAGGAVVGPEGFPEGDEYAQDPHVYGTFCDCRPGPLEAFRVELAGYAETHLHAFDTHEPVPGLTKAHYAILANRFFTRVEVGPTVDHMTFTARI